jgi:lipopolysaccharide/colanic/teichoic acid biosynthesis glycosyltransferase
LDELPQLVNILTGNMSLIGPRPVAEYVARSTERKEPKYSFRSLVLPGITGWAQVKSGYAETTDQEVEKLAYDLYYIKHQSFDLDLLVLFKTVQTVMLGVGAR